MPKEPGLGYKIMATVTGVKGECGAGHRVGDSFEISCHNPAGLCGFFYSPYLSEPANVSVRR
jgi:uncharacterized repeat protein (TIGR04076 family)